MHFKFVYNYLTDASFIKYTYEWFGDNDFLFYKCWSLKLFIRVTLKIGVMMLKKISFALLKYKMY